MRIAICDDEEAQRKLLVQYGHEWSEMRQIPAQIESYASGESFWFIWEEEKDFDLLILDIEMGEMNGIELAMKLREQNQDIPILFVTGYESYMALGYEVSALHYLVKPVQKQKFFSVLDKALKKQPPEERLFFQTDRGAVSLPVSELWYIEAQGHTCNLHTKDSCYTVHMGINEVMRELADRNSFIFCHRSYIVNLTHVAAIEKTELLLDNKAILPLSRSAAKEVNQAFIRYYRS